MAEDEYNKAKERLVAKYGPKFDALKTGGAGEKAPVEPESPKAEPKWNVQKLQDVFGRLMDLQQKQAEAKSLDEFNDLDRQIHDIQVPDSSEVRDADPILLDLYHSLSNDFSEIRNKTKTPEPEHKEPVFNGNVKIIDGLHKKFFADFKKAVLEGGTEPEAEEKIREAVGKHFYALISGDTEGYLRLLETNAPRGSNQRITNALVRDNIPKLLDKILKRYGTTPERLREKLGTAYSDLYFDRVPVTPLPESEEETPPTEPAPSSSPPIPSAPLGAGGEGGTKIQQEKREQEGQKFEADPLRKLASQYGINIRQGDLTYKFMKAEDVGKERAGVIGCKNYSDYRAYLDTLSPYQRDLALLYEGIGIWAPKVVWEKRDQLGKNDLEQWRTIEEKIRLGYAADEYGGKPEVTPKTKDELKDLEERIREEFNISLWSDYKANDDANYYAFQKLERVLQSLSPEDVKEINMVRVNVQNQVEETGRIAFNPDAPEDQIANWLKTEAIPASTAIQKKSDEAREILFKLYKDSGGEIDVYYYLYGEKLLQGAKSLEAALKDIPRSAERLAFEITAEGRSLGGSDRVVLKWDMSPEEMKTAILEYLKNNQK